MTWFDCCVFTTQAIKADKVKAAFKGVVLGDSWISPVDYVATWGPYLHSMVFDSFIKHF